MKPSSVRMLRNGHGACLSVEKVDRDGSDSQIMFCETVL